MSPRALSALFGLWARRRAQRVEALAARAVEHQRLTLRRLTEIAADTTFGRTHGFRDVFTPEEFARRVPVRRYVDYLPWISRILAGEPDVTWPGRPRYFAKTSGTTAGDKAIPVTDAMVAQNRKAGRDALAFHLRATPSSRLFDGTLLFLGGSTALGPAEGGGLVGDLSGIMAAELPFWLRSRVAPSPRVVAIGSWDLKLEAMARETLRQDLRLIAGMPSWTLLLCERWLQLSGARTIAELFPRLELLVHGGVRFEPYRGAVEAMLGEAVRRLEVYTASEGFVAVQDDTPSRGMLLGLDYGSFYEFVPLADLGSDSPRRLTLGDVRPGETYSILLSNPAGLWAYEIGDLVRFVSVSPPRIVVAGRTMAFSNCCGENLIVEEVEHAFVAAAAATRTSPREFTVAPLWTLAVDRRPRLEWVVEAEGEPAAFPSAAFAAACDAALRERNHDYDTKREGDVGMLAPLVTPVPPGTFHEFLGSRGRLGGQHKVPRLRNDRDVADGVLSSAPAEVPLAS